MVGALSSPCIAAADTLTSILPLGECQRYHKLLTERHLLANPQVYTYCPNTHCTRLLRVDGNETADQVLVCLCGTLWCAMCKLAPHWPVGCDHAHKYLKKLEADGILNGFSTSGTDDRMVKVRRCPHCRTPMQKNEGCNHIMCRCGSDFCYACGGKWTGGQHYACRDRDRFERIRMTDVTKETINLLSVKYYDLCIVHRQKHADRNHIGDLVAAVQRNATKAHLDAAPQLRSFADFYKQAHEVLERCYVWMYFYERVENIDAKERADRRAYCRALMRLTHRLTFVLDRIGAELVLNKMPLVMDMMPKAVKLLNTIAARVKRAKVMTELKTTK